MAYSYMMKYKGQYRLKAKIDYNTMDYPRDTNGNLEANDVYIDCYNDIEIHHYGGSSLMAYIPSLGRGRNICKDLKENKNDNIIDKYIETDEEVLIYFNAKDLDILFKYTSIKPKTSGASISPFSVRNLPRSKHKWNKYKTENKKQYNEMIRLIKEWLPTLGMRFDKGYEYLYQEFSKEINIDIVEKSKKENYKPLHIIDQEGYTPKVIEWLRLRLE